MKSGSSRIIASVIVILTLLLASCGGGGASQATEQVPITGETATVPAGGATSMATEAGTPAATGMATEAGTAVGTPTVVATGEATGATTGTPAAGETPGAAVGQTTPWQGEQIGGTVTVLAIWGGSELDNFNAMIAPFQEQTGIQVQVETTRDLGNVLNTRISGGNPPDVAGLPNPGQMIELARAGSLLSLEDVLDRATMEQQYDKGFLDLASVDGQLYGIFTKAAVKSLVWYNPKAFEAKGYEIPTTWEELQALEEKIVADGGAPWCIGIDGGGGSGWPGTDWIEDILLHQSGPETYDQWVRHEIPWTDPSVKQAWETFGEIVNEPSMVDGGSTAVIATNFGEAFNPMFGDAPTCYMHRQANFITTFFTDQFPDLQAGEDYNFFSFPAPNAEYQDSLLVAGDLFGMFNDTPQARALMQYLVTPDAQSIWAERGGFISANKLVDPQVYPDDITRQIGEMITQASSVRFDGSDQMPQAVNSAFSDGILQFPGNPDNLDSILEGIEAQAAESYTQ